MLPVLAVRMKSKAVAVISAWAGRVTREELATFTHTAMVKVDPPSSLYASFVLSVWGAVSGLWQSVRVKTVLCTSIAWGRIPKGQGWATRKLYRPI